MLHFRQNEGDNSILVSNLHITNATQNISIDKSLMSHIEEKKKKEMVYL